MNTLNNAFCCGCLDTERKMELLEDYWTKSDFLQLFTENTMSHSEEPLWLCWECKGLFHKFLQFKKQVASCHNILLNHSEQVNIEPTTDRVVGICSTKNGDEKECLKQKEDKYRKPPRLNTYKLFTTSYMPEKIEIETESTFEIIKVKKEVPQLDDIKPDPENCDVIHDIDTTLDNFSDDDDKLLITMTKKKTKKSDKTLNGHRKKKKKEIAIYKELVLEREDIEKEREALMLSEDYVNAMFKCDRCIMSFPNADDLKDHVNAKHNQDATHKCNICECTFSTEISYNYHTNKHRKRYECRSCMERFNSKRAVTKHYEHTHCTGPPQDFTTDKLEAPIDNTDTDKPSYKCEFCDKVFKWKTSLRKHTETHSIETGQKRRPYCEPCRLSFTTTSNLQKHVKTSSKHQIQLKLMKLKESLPEDSTLENQEARIELIVRCVNGNKQRYKCVQCDKRFQWRGNLLRHMHSHQARANGELVCAPCDRTFSSIATYQQHMKISRKHVSESEFKYMCAECGKRFANKTRLKDHVDWDHLKNYVHTCPHCQKVFKSHTSLYLHKQVVHRPKGAGHLCDHCGKSFPNHAKLRSHITALHTNQSPYTCPTCSARFSWHSCLSRHMRRVHRGKQDSDITQEPS